MDALWFYLFATVPLLVGGLFWALGRKVVWGEWLGGAALGFCLAGLFHLLAAYGQTRDVETWSGSLTDGRHTGRWQEYYEEAVYRTESYQSGTDSKGNPIMSTREVFSHWESHRRWHDHTYTVESNIGTAYSLNREGFYRIAQTWGGVRAVPGTRSTSEHASRMIDGDPNDYVTRTTGYIWPVTRLVTFENRVKATPTTFSYAPVPPQVQVFDYPRNGDPFKSDRLLGSAALLDRFAFDQLNARLGPHKRVNVILVGFGDRDSSVAQWQEAAWVGGKKNDIVLCWGGSNTKPTWTRAFGWTERKTCLRNLETLALTRGVTDALFPAIEQEIVANYQIKDWKKFDYIKVPVPTWAVLTYFLTTVVAQVSFWWWAHRNEFEKAVPGK